MTQLNLPLYNPRDRGRRNALQNILISITDELRRTAPIAQEIVALAVDLFPELISSYTPLDLNSPDYSNPSLVSPLAFEIHDLLRERRKDVYPSMDELINQLDLETLAQAFENAELIGIDESKVDTPLAHSSMAFLKSVAFRMYRMPNGQPDEATGPILSELRMQFQEGETFENENQLLGYIRNNYIAYVSALTALAYGRNPFVVLHGPLVRAIGGFSQITFDYETARDLFNVDLADAGEFDVPQPATGTINGDRATENNLPLSPQSAISGEENIRKFNEFCLFSCGRKCESVKALRDQNAVPKAASTVTKTAMAKRRYPGFCLYFWGLRSLVDLSRLSPNTTIASVVENISAATEMTRIVLPSLLANSAARTPLQRHLKHTLKTVGITFPSDDRQIRDIFLTTKTLIEKLRLSDSNLFSYVLSEGQFTAPVQIYRYRTRNTHDAAFANNSMGVLNDFENILNAIFPATETPSHPGYRVFMSYVRTTPLREPVRVEYFDLPHFRTPSRIIGPLYLLSLPYQEYGLPIILYYADKVARTPTNLVKTIIEREYLELVLRNNFSDPVSIMTILGRLSRGYFQREGLQ